MVPTITTIAVNTDTARRPMVAAIHTDLVMAVDTADTVDTEQEEVATVASAVMAVEGATVPTEADTEEICTVQDMNPTMITTANMEVATTDLGWVE
jgi:hypothetical protein